MDTITATLNVEPRDLIHSNGYEISVEHGNIVHLAPTSLPANDDHEQAKTAAEDVLAAAGWTVTGDWEQHDSCYTATVEREQ